MDEHEGEAEDRAVEIPIGAELDLHSFAPRDIPSLSCVQGHKKDVG